MIAATEPESSPAAPAKKPAGGHGGRLQRRLFLASLWLSLALLLAGCRRAPAPRPPTFAPDESALAATLPWTVQEQRFPARPGADARGIAVDARGTVYLAAGSGVRVYGPDGALRRAWSTRAPAQCIAVGTSGRIYVGMIGLVTVFDPDGKVLARWRSPAPAAPAWRMITDIAVREPDVFVSDAGLRCVIHFAMNGDVVGAIARRDPDNGEPGLLVPSPHLGCAAAPGNRLLVANPGKRQVQTRSFTGKLLGAFGRSGLNPGAFSGCCNPVRVAWISSPGPAVATAEKGVRRIQVFSLEGALLAYIGAGHFARTPPALALATGTDGSLYVLDPPGNRILRFHFARKSLPASGQAHAAER